MHIGKTLLSATVGFTRYRRFTLTCCKPNIRNSVTWAARYVRNTSQVKLWNSAQLARVLAETLKFPADTTHYSSLGELIKESTL